MKNNKIITKAYQFVEKNLSNGDIYFEGHVLPIAKTCKYFAPIFEADPLISELGGLFHDIGYSKKHEKDSRNHIAKGVEITTKYLKNSGINPKDALKIVDCVRTHDGNLMPTSPIENMLVNDIDAIMFFCYPQTSYNLLKRFGFEDKEVFKRLKKHAKETFSLIYGDFFKKKGKKLYESFLLTLDDWEKNAEKS